MKKKKSVLKDLLFVSISSFIVTAAWIGFNIYHTWVTTTITPEMQVTITAINPEFDAATIQKLKARKQVVPITSLSGKPVEEPTPAQLPSGIPLATTPAPEEESLLPTPTLGLGTGVSAGTGTTTGTGTGTDTQPQAQPQVSNIPVTVNGE